MHLKASTFSAKSSNAIHVSSTCSLIKQLVFRLLLAHRIKFLTHSFYQNEDNSQFFFKQKKWIIGRHGILEPSLTNYLPRQNQPAILSGFLFPFLVLVLFVWVNEKLSVSSFEGNKSGWWTISERKLLKIFKILCFINLRTMRNRELRKELSD